MIKSPLSPPAARAVHALQSVLPLHLQVEVDECEGVAVVGGSPITLHWIGEGWPSDVRRAIEEGIEVDVLAARAFSEGARRILRDRRIGWVDETGAAEISKDMLVVSRSGDPKARRRTRSRAWTPAVLAVTEAVLMGVPAKVKETMRATGLSNGACGDALRLLADEGFLEQDAARGPRSGRRLVNPAALLDVYAEAAAERSEDLSLELGVLWSDAVDGAVEIGERLQEQEVRWAATGGVAAHVLAPHLTTVPSADLYVDAATAPQLDLIAARLGLKAMKGGRLVLRPFPAKVTSRLSQRVNGLRIAPWPRVYADLLPRGVRGQEAAEHLREVMSDS